MKKLLFLFAVILLFNHCSEDDSVTMSNLETINGGIIKTSQIVEINLQDIPLENYNGDINGISVPLAKGNEDTLSFVVTPDFPIGQVTLTIESLNLAINYTIEQTILQNTVEGTIRAFSTSVQSGIDQISDPSDKTKAQEVLNSMNDFLNSLSETDKRAAAEFYQSNRVLLEAAIEGDFSRVNSGFLDNLSECEKGKYATGILGVVTVGLAGSGLGTIYSVISGSATVIALILTIDYCSEAMNSQIKSIFLKADELLSEARNSKNSSIDIYSEVDRSISISLGNRALLDKDRSDQNTFISRVFSAIDDLNIGIIGNLNRAVVRWNNYAPSFFSISPFETLEINNNSEVTEISLTQELFDNLSFSIPNENVEIESLTFSDGGVNINVKIIDPTALTGDFIETAFEFTYTDDFNNFTGSFPLKIMLDPCKGATAPVLSNLRLACENGVVVLVDFTADGLGVSAIGGTNLYLRSKDETEFTFATNGYTTQLRSGDANQGTIAIYIAGTAGSCGVTSDPYDALENAFGQRYIWKVELVNGCNQTSNDIIF